MKKIISAKDYLRQGRRLGTKIKDKSLELKELRALSTSVSSTLSDGSGSKTNAISDRVGIAVMKIVDLENEIETAIVALVDLKREIESRINSVSDENFQDVLFKRYVLCQEWEQIAVDMGYTYRHVLTLHGKAITEFSKNFSQDFI